MERREMKERWSILIKNIFGSKEMKKRIRDILIKYSVYI
jgi:hypothetical protein